MDRRAFLKTTSIGAAGAIAAGLGADGAFLQASDAPAARPPLPVLVLRGSPRERGRMHGESLRGKIVELVPIWKAHLGRPDSTTPDAYVERFLADTRFEAAIARWTPDVLEEIRGIAEGSGVAFRTVLAMQLVDEEWWYSANGGVPAPTAGSGEKCTVIGVARTATSPTLVAQNLDIPGWYEPFLTLLRIEADARTGLETLLFSAAGLVAMNGLNSRGVAVAVNALLQLADSGDGLPVACVIRGILERGTLGEAERFVREVRHASGQAYTIGGADGVACYECSAGRAARLEPKAGRIAHTNHPLVNDDLSPLGRRLAAGGTDAPGPRNSVARLRAAECRIVDAAGAVDVAAIEAALGSHDAAGDPVCRHLVGPDAGFTAATTVFVLDPAAPRLHVAPNPPCARAFTEHGWS